LNVSAAEVDDLSKDPTWLRLLHFEGSTSRVDSKDFFIHPKGHQNPKQELLATIQAFTQARVLENDRWSAACAFPARYQFLQERGYVFPKVTCAEYDQWRKLLPIKSVSIVFSSYYPGNPASIFGHTFLKLNFNENHQSKLTDYAVSFSARATDPVGVIYAIKGLLGGYQGFYEISPYYMKVNEYLHTESRDLWEYPILMSETQMDRLLAHLWELSKKASYSYWFMSENCSFQLLALLDATYGDTNFAKNAPTIVLPARTLTLLNEAQKLGKGSIRPSFKKQLLYRYNLLSRDEKETLSSNDTSARVLDVKIAVVRYQQLSVNEKPQERAKLTKELLPLIQKRAALGTKTPDFSQEWINSMNAEDPLLAHDPHRLQLSSGSKNGQLLNRIESRFGLHSPLDREDGMPHHSEVNYFSIAIEYTKRDFYLQKFRIIDILSLQPANIASSGFSWRAGAGALRRLGYLNKTLPQVNFAGGYSLAPTQTLTLYALLGAESLIHLNKFKHTAIGNTLELGLLISPTWSRLRAHLLAYAFYDYTRAKTWSSLSLQTQYDLNHKWEIGLSGETIFNTPYQLEKKSNQYLAMINRHF
tara:strand:+ start:12064 stop:13827 length:1764 start_codon:yes stop_codon:yes gene_type:complete